MAEISEKFNVEEVKNKMDTLETAFNALSDALSEANKIVNEEVNVGPESVLFGELGTILLNTWNENASTFGDFHANFESWAQVVSVIAANNMSFTEETIKAYKDDGSTLTYKDDTNGERKTISSLREEKAQEQTINYVKNNFSEDKYDITESDNSLVIKDKNGNIVVEYSMENGKITSTKWYDSDGNYSVITYEVGEDGKLKKNVTYYDANGNVIEKPSSFYEDGTLRPDLSNNQEESGSSDTNGESDEDNETDEQENITEVNLSELKVGDEITIGTEKYVVSEENGVRTITLKNGEQIQILSDGTVKSLYGGEFEINGQKIQSTAYTDDELRSYYAELNKNESSYRYKNAEEQNVDVTIAQSGDNTFIKSVVDGQVSLEVKGVNGENVNISYRDAAKYFDENCTSLTYVGMNGNTKVLTRDPNIGYFAVKDSDGTLTCYDSDLNEMNIADTNFADDGTFLTMPRKNILAGTKQDDYKIEFEKIKAKYKDYEAEYAQSMQGNEIYDKCCELQKKLIDESNLLTQYLQQNTNLNEDVVNFLNEQQSIRTQMLEKLEDDLYYGWGIGNDGVIGDLVSDYHTKYAYTKAYETLDKYNEILANVSSITNLNYALDTIGCPKIE